MMNKIFSLLLLFFPIPLIGMDLLTQEKRQPKIKNVIKEKEKADQKGKEKIELFFAEHSDSERSSSIFSDTENSNSSEGAYDPDLNDLEIYALQEKQRQEWSKRGTSSTTSSLKQENAGDAGNYEGTNNVGLDGISDIHAIDVICLHYGCTMSEQNMTFFSNKIYITALQKKLDEKKINDHKLYLTLASLIEKSKNNNEHPDILSFEENFLKPDSHRSGKNLESLRLNEITKSLLQETFNDFFNSQKATLAHAKKRLKWCQYFSIPFIAAIATGAFVSSIAIITEYYI